MKKESISIFNNLPADKNQNFEFCDFTTFSKNEMNSKYTTNTAINITNNQMVQHQGYMGSNHASSHHETSSQYKSFRSNNTLNNYCSIHQINGNFQSHDYEYFELSKYSNILFIILNFDSNSFYNFSKTISKIYRIRFLKSSAHFCYWR